MLCHMHAELLDQHHLLALPFPDITWCPTGMAALGRAFQHVAGTASELRVVSYNVLANKYAVSGCATSRLLCAVLQRCIPVTCHKAASDIPSMQWTQSAQAQPHVQVS